MPYLYISDYSPPIQPALLNQLVQSNDIYRIREQNKALSIVKGRLQQKYDVSQEFTETLPFSISTTYQARSRIIIDFPVWATLTTYVINSLIIHNGSGYVCTTGNSDATFTIGNWAALGAQYTIYFCSYPPTCTYPPTLAQPNAPVFNVNQPYNLGDIVYWKGYTYVCTNPSCRITAEQMIQYYRIGNIPYINVFPDDAVNNASSQFWGTKTAYSIPVGTLPANTTYWTQGDNREQQIVDAMRWCVICGLAPLISPKGEPENWKNNYHRVLDAVDQMKDGGITVDIPLLQPNVGKRMRYGGEVKQPSTYSLFPILIWLIPKIMIAVIALAIIIWIRNMQKPNGSKISKNHWLTKRKYP